MQTCFHGTVDLTHRGSYSITERSFRSHCFYFAKDIIAAVKTASDGPMNGILGWTDEEVVSNDFKSDKLVVGLRHRSVHRIERDFREVGVLVRQRAP